MATAALAAALPDIALVMTIRNRWLPRDHPVIKAHAFLHQSPWGLVVAAGIGWVSHIVTDRYSDHDLAPGVRGRRGWRW